MNRVSDLGLEIDLSTDKEVKQYWMESRKPKFISEIDEMSTKINTLQFPLHINGSDSNYVSDEEKTCSITSD
jgi:hypothetical protein